MTKDRQYKVFKQPFTKPLKTAYGTWSERESLVLRENRGNEGMRYGEVAPTLGFTDFHTQDLLKEAKLWSKGNTISPRSPLNCALSCMNSKIWMNHEDYSETLKESAVLVEEYNDTKRENLTLKKKIGLARIEEEIEETMDWFRRLPASAKVRLDPNRSLDFSGLLKWADALEGEKRIEFIEEPTQYLSLKKLIEFVEKKSVKIALDESVVAHGGPKKLLELGWSGLFVIKPTLLKDWNDTINFIKENPKKSVVSTVFESPFGFEATVRCSGYSKLVPGLERNFFQTNELETKEHHCSPLKIPSLSIQQLNELWLKIPE